ncbi:MAG TPA: hypothetical protein VKR78_07215, partial [Acidimicrobiales bacterium]|nr:hypothetical protein [Acidimicrobiales bacterium]
MSHPLQVNNPLVVAAFHAALIHQFLIALGVGVGLAILWNVAFNLQHRRLHLAAAATSGEHAAAGNAAFPRGAARVGTGPGAAAVHTTEPPARRFLRVAFGLLWILDGILQGQSSMPLGMPTGVVRPAAAASPDWVRHLVNWAMT